MPGVGPGALAMCTTVRVEKLARRLLLLELATHAC